MRLVISLQVAVRSSKSGVLFCHFGSLACVLIALFFFFFFSSLLVLRMAQSGRGRLGGDDFYWGSEVDEALELDDDGDALEDEDSGSSDERGVAVSEEVASEGENEEDVEDNPSAEADGAAAALMSMVGEWKSVEISAGDAVPAERVRSKSSFLEANPLGMAGKQTPSDFVFEFLSHRFFKNVLNCTQDHQMNDDKHPKDRRAKKIELHELYQFFGILDILSIRCASGAKADCWSANPYLECKPIKDVMSFRRFSLIKRHLKMAYCSNLSEQEILERNEDDRLWRVRLLLDEMTMCNTGKFEMNGIKTLDEQVIQAHQQRMPKGLKQQFPNKPIGTGIRVESLNDRSGFTMSALLTQDAKRFDEIMRLYPEAAKNLTLSRQKYFACVMQGVQHQTFQRGSYMVIVMDNLFIHPSLAEELFRYGICVLGTWRKNFGVPTELLKSKVTNEKPYVAMERKFKVQRNRTSVEGTMLGVKILGHGSKKKGFYMLTTCPDIGVKKLLAKLPYGNGEEQQILELNHVYNMGKIGTDVEDQLRASYAIEMRPRRWHLAILYWGYREQTVQGYICFRKMFPLKRLSHKDFLLQHAEFLLRGGPDAPLIMYSSPRSPRSPRSPDTPGTPRVTKQLRLDVMQNRNVPHAIEKGPMRQCVLCKDNNIRRRTTWCCPPCSFVPICKHCFTDHMRP